MIQLFWAEKNTRYFPCDLLGQTAERSDINVSLADQRSHLHAVSAGCGGLSLLREFVRSLSTSALPINRQAATLAVFVRLPAFSLLTPISFTLLLYFVAGVDFWTTQHAGSASLTVQFQHSCYTGDFLELVIIANVAGTGQPGDNCQFVHDSGRCTETLHTYTCSCDDSNNTYTIIFTEAIDRSTNEWEVTGKLAMSKQEIKERVTLRRRGKMLIWFGAVVWLLLLLRMLLLWVLLLWVLLPSLVV